MLHRDTRIFHVGTQLEEDVFNLFKNLGGCNIEKGPTGEHDLILRFNQPIKKTIKDNQTVQIHPPRKRFVIEVKSHARSGATVSDLRQLHDWVLRETRMDIAANDQQNAIREFFDTLDEIKQKYNEIVEVAKNYEQNEDEFDGEINELSNLLDNMDYTSKNLVHALTYRVKGILIINHHCGANLEDRKVIAEVDALEYAKLNDLVIIAWSDLLQVLDKVNSQDFDILNLFCAIYESCGLIKYPIQYDWVKESSFYYNYFQLVENTDLMFAWGPAFLM